MSEFRYIWSKSCVYEQKYFNNTKFNYVKTIDYDTFEIDDKTIASNIIEPNYMQEKTLDNLKRVRKNNEKKALVIATTGTGKTYLAAFDVMEFKPKRMLFIAHREELIQNAKKTFEKVILKKSMGVFTGGKKEEKKEFVFATVQSLNKHLNSFSKDSFDYVIVDEAHHITSETYKTILDYLEPKFLLGLTATPERTDGKDIYRIFDNNVVMELRIKEALEEKLIVPFHYYGISDIKDIDLSNLDLTKIDEVAKKLMVHKRTDYIVEKLNFYGYSGEKRKILGFCANIAHAKFMAEEFNKLGIKSKVLTGENTPEERKKNIEKLNSQNLEVIFTVDIFNEGIDIPNINTILMLRPTSSSVVFIQQLGRGLRKSEGKEFLTVLDFIGNHNKTYLIALALMGNETKNKDKLRVALKNNFSYFSKEIVISMDEIAKENILAQINATNFSALKYFKEEYETFKNISLKGRVPTYLDYLNYEGAPDILRFIKK
ncbi:MAG: DEAD/DEAH box helicase, partial [Fusobacteriaceae bacterium]